ncbi:MAG: hypothetical protein Q9205_007779 [Flavoplaca limonia]
MYEYYEISGDRDYAMVLWSRREDRMIGRVVMEAESGLKLSSPWVQLEGKSDDEPDLPSNFPSMNFSWLSGKAE